MGNELTSVMIVDDHFVTAFGTKQLFEQQGYKVVAIASDGKEALQKMDSLNLNLVLFDISMPTMNGIEFASIARKRFPNVQLVAFSGDISGEKISKLRNLGVSGLVGKNSTDQEWELILKNVLAGKIVYPTIIEERARIFLIRKLKLLDEQQLRFLRSYLLIVDIKNHSLRPTAQKLNLSHTALDKRLNNLLSRLDYVDEVELISEKDAILILLSEPEFSNKVNI